MKNNNKFETGITRKCRLLCGECDTLQRVKTVSFDTHGDTVVLLHCDHKRGELLPLKEGRISLEHVERNDKIAYAMFPAVFTEALAA